MLHRFLFVAGMTVGVMTPLVWSAYVAQPASHEARASAVGNAKSVEAAPNMPGLAPVPAKHLAAREAMKNVATMDDVTTSIRPASMKPAPEEPTRLVAHPKASTPHSVRHTKLTRPHLKRANPTQPRRMAHRSEDRAIPAVVNRYNGAHIIIVCAALTANDQLRVGCP